jgi:long-subunit fatty acid transport protein
MVRGLLTRGSALLLWLVASGLDAQSIALPASDPVGIGRGGAGVAFGRSLEASALNPALLVTLDDRRSFYLAGGMDLEAGELTLQSNQRTLYTTDRNRFLPAFGVAFRVGDRFALGLFGDTPFARHQQLPLESTARFAGDRMELRADRIQLQAGYRVSDRFSLGAGIGVARMTYSYGSTFRAQVPFDPTQPVSSANPSQGLVETGVRASAHGVAPTVSLGFRFAVNPRWTFGGSLQGPLKSSMTLAASMDGRTPTVYANDGYSSPSLGTSAAAAVLMNRVSAVDGSGDLQLPMRLTVGVRQRVNQLFTWEFDLRYLDSSRFKAPNGPQLSTPSGQVSAPAQSIEYRNASGMTLLGELTLNKSWTLRASASLEQAWTSEATVTPLFGGAKSAAFSGGFGFKVWGGELIAGYQFRQSKDLDSANFDGTWSRLGYHTTGTTTRIEGMGHLYSIGFQRRF